MAGRGPAPKPNAIDRKRGVKERHKPVPPAEGLPVPAGSWHPCAVAWWQRMTTAAVAATWRAEDHAVLERGLALVDQFWRAHDEGQAASSVNLSNAVLRIETALWLNPSERARQGVKVDLPAAPAAGSSSSARARLRSLDGGVAS